MPSQRRSGSGQVQSPRTYGKELPTRSARGHSQPTGGSTRVTRARPEPPQRRNGRGQLWASQSSKWIEPPNPRSPQAHSPGRARGSRTTLPSRSKPAKGRSSSVVGSPQTLTKCRSRSAALPGQPQAPQAQSPTRGRRSSLPSRTEPTKGRSRSAAGNPPAKGRSRSAAGNPHTPTTKGRSRSVQGSCAAKDSKRRSTSVDKPTIAKLAPEGISHGAGDNVVEMQPDVVVETSAKARARKVKKLRRKEAEAEAVATAVMPGGQVDAQAPKTTDVVPAEMKLRGCHTAGDVEVPPKRDLESQLPSSNPSAKAQKKKAKQKEKRQRRKEATQAIILATGQEEQIDRHGVKPMDVSTADAVDSFDDPLNRTPQLHPSDPLHMMVDDHEHQHLLSRHQHHQYRHHHHHHHHHHHLSDGPYIDDDHHGHRAGPYDALDDHHDGDLSYQRDTQDHRNHPDHFGHHQHQSNRHSHPYRHHHQTHHPHHHHQHVNSTKQETYEHFENGNLRDLNEEGKRFHREYCYEAQAKLMSKLKIGGSSSTYYLSKRQQPRSQPFIVPIPEPAVPSSSSSAALACASTDSNPCSPIDTKRQSVDCMPKSSDISTPAPTKETAVTPPSPSSQTKTKIASEPYDSDDSDWGLDGSEETSPKEVTNMKPNNEDEFAKHNNEDEFDDMCWTDVQGFGPIDQSAKDSAKDNALTCTTETNPFQEENLHLNQPKARQDPHGEAMSHTTVSSSSSNEPKETKSPSIHAQEEPKHGKRLSSTTDLDVPDSKKQCMAADQQVPSRYHRKGLHPQSTHSQDEPQHGNHILSPTSASRDERQKCSVSESTSESESQIHTSLEASKNDIVDDQSQMKTRDPQTSHQESEAEDHHAAPEEEADEDEVTWLIHDDSKMGEDFDSKKEEANPNPEPVPVPQLGQSAAQNFQVKVQREEDSIAEAFGFYMSRWKDPGRVEPTQSNAGASIQNAAEATDRESAQNVATATNPIPRKINTHTYAQSNSDKLAEPVDDDKRQSMDSDSELLKEDIDVAGVCAPSATSTTPAPKSMTSPTGSSTPIQPTSPTSSLDSSPDSQVSLDLFLDAQNYHSDSQTSERMDESIPTAKETCDTADIDAQRACSSSSDANAPPSKRKMKPEDTDTHQAQKYQRRSDQFLDDPTQQKLEKAKSKAQKAAEEAKKAKEKEEEKKQKAKEKKDRLSKVRERARSADPFNKGLLQDQVRNAREKSKKADLAWEQAKAAAKIKASNAKLAAVQAKAAAQIKASSAKLAAVQAKRNATLATKQGKATSRSETPKRERSSSSGSSCVKIEASQGHASCEWSSWVEILGDLGYVTDVFEKAGIKSPSHLKDIHIQTLIPKKGHRAKLTRLINEGTLPR